MAEKIVKVGLVRDYRNYLYFIDGTGNVCRRAKGGSGTTEILRSAASLGFTREKGWLYYIDKEGDVSRSPMAARKPKTAPAEVEGAAV